jgi:hypothetical protein
VTALDVYAARCAMVHTQIAESRLSRSGDAVEIWYGLEDGAALLPFHDVQRRLPVVINLTALLAAAERAYRAFLAAIGNDADIFSRVQPRSKECLEVATTVESPVGHQDIGDERAQ